MRCVYACVRVCAYVRVYGGELGKLLEKWCAGVPIRQTHGCVLCDNHGCNVEGMSLLVLVRRCTRSQMESSAL